MEKIHRSGMEQFTQKTSIAKIFGMAVFITVMLLVVQALGVFISTQKFVTDLSEIHRTQAILARLGEVRQASQVLLDTFERPSENEAGIKSSQEVFQGIFGQVTEKMKDLQASTRGDAELTEYLLKTQEAISQLNQIAMSNYTASRALRTPSGVMTLLARQAQLDAFDFASKARILIQGRADRTFNTLYGRRYEPLIAVGVMGMVFTSVILGGGLSLKRRFLQSIENLVKAATEVSRGNLQFQAPILHPDEIGLLTNVFNHMTDSLRESTVSRKYVEAVIDSMPDALFVIRPEGVIQRVNQVAVHSLGYSMEELLGKPMVELLSGGTNFLAIEAIERVGLLRDKETSLIAKDGAMIPVSVSASIMFDPSTGLRSMISIAKNISEVKEAEERYRSLVEAAGDAIITADSLGVITSFNKGAELSFGYLAVEIIGKPLTTIMPERFKEPHLQGFERFLKTQTPHLIGMGPVELAGRKKDGSEFPVEISLATSQIGRGVFFSAIIRDISERKKNMLELQTGRDRLEVLSHQLEERNVALAVANKELEAFSYSVSHDLRAPLRSVDGFSKALLTTGAEQLDERSKDYLARIRESAQRMGKLIDDLLNLSRLSRKEMHTEAVDLSAMVEKVSAEIQKTDPERKVEWVIQSGAIVDGDANLLYVALENLLGNSWKYTSKHPHARIEFGISEKDGKKIYSVRDDGAGFDMAYADKLFTPFQRLHGIREFPGTGIGLALVKRIIHRHGGEVWAKGETEKGAEFSFTLGESSAA